jgi:hypothetical protein
MLQCDAQDWNVPLVAADMTGTNAATSTLLILHSAESHVPQHTCQGQTPHTILPPGRVRIDPWGSVGCGIRSGVLCSCRPDAPVLRGLSAPTGAFRAHAEELEAVANLGEAVAAGQAGIHLGQDAIVQAHDLAAGSTDQVMMMVAIGIGVGDLESGQAIPEIDSSHQTHAFEQGHRTVDRGQVAPALRHRVHNLLGRRRPPQPLQGLKDLPPRPRYPPCLPPQTFHPVRRWRMLAAAVRGFCIHAARQPTVPRPGSQGPTPSIPTAG